MAIYNYLAVLPFSILIYQMGYIWYIAELLGTYFGLGYVVGIQCTWNISICSPNKKKVSYGKCHIFSGIDRQMLVSLCEYMATITPSTGIL